MPGGGETPTYIKCFKCGELVQCANEYHDKVMRCFKCGKIGHRIADYKSDETTCYNCDEQGHISTNCQKTKKVPSGGKVFDLNRS